MEREGCDFDAARLIYNQEKMREAGIDPETGLSLDPKAVTNPDDFERVFAGPASDGLGARLRTKVDQTAAWWRRQSELFGFRFVPPRLVVCFDFGPHCCDLFGRFLRFGHSDFLSLQGRYAAPPRVSCEKVCGDPVVGDWF